MSVDNFLREGWGCVNLMIFILLFLDLEFWFDRENIVPGNFGFARY